jgi:hypothetical protein
MFYNLYLFVFVVKKKENPSGSILRIISQGKMAEIRPTAAPLHLTDDNAHVVHALLERRINNKLYKTEAKMLHNIFLQQTPQEETN